MLFDYLHLVLLDFAAFLQLHLVDLELFEGVKEEPDGVVEALAEIDGVLFGFELFGLGEVVAEVDEAACELADDG